MTVEEKSVLAFLPSNVAVILIGGDHHHICMPRKAIFKAVNGVNHSWLDDDAATTTLEIKFLPFAVDVLVHNEVPVALAFSEQIDFFLCFVHVCRSRRIAFHSQQLES